MFRPVLGFVYWEAGDFRWQCEVNKTKARTFQVDEFCGFEISAVSNRSMMKFEAGYTVETVFDGSKLGIEPYSVEVAPSGELLVLDSENSNMYKISTPLSRCKILFALNSFGIVPHFIVSHFAFLVRSDSIFLEYYGLDFLFIKYFFRIPNSSLVKWVSY